MTSRVTRRSETRRKLASNVVAVATAFVLVLTQTPINYAVAEANAKSAEDVAANLAETAQAAVSEVGVSFDHAYIVYGGQVIAEPATQMTVPEASDLTFSVEADTGYRVTSVVLTGDAGSQELAPAADGTYTAPADKLVPGAVLAVGATPAEDDEVAEPAAGETVEAVSDDEAAAADSDEEAADEPESDDGASPAADIELAYSDGAMKVTATLPGDEPLPEGAFLQATRLTDATDGYDYDAYMQALNDAADDMEYTADNTMLYDIAIMVPKTDESGATVEGEYVEYEPQRGQVAVSIKFKDDQLADDLAVAQASDVAVTHLPLAQVVRDAVESTGQATDLQASDVSVQAVADASASVSNETLGFTLDGLSIVAVTDTGASRTAQAAAGTGASAQAAVAVQAANTSTDLADFLENASISAPQNADGTYTVVPGSAYSITLAFAESRSLQFPNDGSTLSYKLPEGLHAADGDSGKLTIKVNDGGTFYNITDNAYRIENGVLYFDFNTAHADFEKLAASANAKFNVTFTGSFDESAAGVTFKDGISKDFEVDNTSNVTASKSARFDKATNKVEYTVSVRSQGASKNVVVKDVISGDALKLDAGSIKATSSKGGKVSMKGGASGNSFEYTIAEMSNGEVVTFTYSANVDVAKVTADGDYVDSAGNRVQVTSDGDPTPDVVNRTTVIDYTPTVSKGNGTVVAENGDVKTISWTVVANADAKVSMAGGTITDKISSASQGFMKYSGKGITVKVTDASGKTVRTDTVAWDQLTQKTDAQWTYTVPASDKGKAYKYEVTYTTDVDLTGKVSNTYVGNDVSTDGGKGASGGSNVMPAGGDVKVSKTAEKVDLENREITWNITFNVPEAGLDRAVVTDNYPNKWLNNAHMVEAAKAGSLAVTGLKAGESYDVSYGADKATVTFYQDAAKSKTGLQGGAARTVTVTLKTAIDDDWFKAGSANQYYQFHENSATLDANGDVKYAGASATAIAPSVQKKAQKVGVRTVNGVELPVYRYEVVLANVASDVNEVDDVYDTSLLEPYVYNSWDAFYIFGGGTYSQDVKGGQFSYVFTADGMKMTTTADAMPHDASSPTGFYDKYKLVYYLTVKDEAALNTIISRATANDDGTYAISNGATWNGSTDSADVTYEYQGLKKEILTPDSELRKTDEDIWADFRITLNPGAQMLNGGSPLTMTDTYQNLSIDYTSIKATPADGVSWDVSGNTATYTVPDQTKVVITYRARVVVADNGGSGDTVRINFSNVAEMNGYTDGVSKTAERHNSGAGAASVPVINLMKYQAGNMTNRLQGAKFALLDAEGNPVVGKSGPVTFTTDSNGMITVRGDQEKLGWALAEDTRYYLRETVAPAGYMLADFDYSFQVSSDGTTDYAHYIYHTGDTMSAKNYQGTDVKVAKEWSDGNDRHAADSVTVKLQQKRGDGEWSDAVRMNAKTESGSYAWRDFSDKTVVLDADNDWQAVFGGLPLAVPADLADVDGDDVAVDYRVVETLVNGAAPEKGTVSVERGEQGGAIVFTVNNESTYVATGEARFTATKTLDGRAPAAGAFSFTLTGPDGTVQTKANDAQGTVTFDAVQFSTEDFEFSGTDDEGRRYADFTYTIAEDVPEGAVAVAGGKLVKDGVGYDPVSKTVQVRVTDLGDGTLGVTYDQAPAFEGASFGNTTETVDVSGTKAWADADDQDGLRPEKVTVHLLADGKDTGKKAEVSQATGWEFSFSGLDKYAADGSEVAYTVREDVPAGYTASYSGSVAEGFTVTNTHQTQTTGASVRKVWADDDDRERVRPATVEVQLKADNADYGPTVVLSEANGWSYEWKGLPANAAGTPVKYSVVEVNVPADYVATVDAAEGNAFTVTNTHEVGKTSLTVGKRWDDADNQDGLRSDKVSVQLLADGKAQGQPVELNEDNGWSHTWTDLPQKAAGADVEYTVQETGVPEGYTATVEGSAAAGYTLVNTHEVETTQVKAEKVWNDEDDHDGLRPASVEVQLLADGAAQGQAVVLSEANGWATTWNDLPKYRDGGQEIVYTLAEVSAPAGYRTAVTGDAQTGFTVTNTHMPRYVDASVAKVWNDDDDRDRARPASVQVQLLANGEPYGDALELTAANDWAGSWTHLPTMLDGKDVDYTLREGAVPGYRSEVAGSVAAGFTLTNSRAVDKTEVSVLKVWDDADDRDRLRPDSLEVQLTANGEPYGGAVELSEGNGWSYKWADLPLNEAGQAVDYAVEEVAVPEGYELETTGDATAGFVLTNSHEAATTTAQVLKVWDDADDRDGLRPEAVQVQLLADGEPYGAAVALDESNGWSATWKDLPQNSNGQLVDYSVAELDHLAGYATEVAELPGNAFVVTNSHEAETTTASVRKVWNDDGDRDGLRPDSVEVQLTANGEPYGSAVELNQENSWSYQWADLPLNEAGQAVDYAVEEVAVPDGYAVACGGSAESGFTVTNAHEVEKTSVPVRKVWDDAGNRDALRPDSVTVQLRADGRNVGDPVELNERNGWAYEWTGLPANEAGKALEYSVVELDSPTGYTPSVAWDEEEGAFVATNVHSAEETSVTVVKNWADDADRDGLRPDSIEVQLLANGAAQGQPVELNDSNGWTYTWTGLAANADGTPVEYAVDEVGQIEGYRTSVSGDAASGIVLTNAHDVEKTQVHVEKQWADDDDRDGLRPQSVTVELFADGERVATKEVDAAQDGTWSCDFTGLDKYRDHGTAIEYTVAESPVPKGYAATVEGDAQEGFVITNKHETATTDVSGAKEWVDGDGRDGTRPDSITVRLLADGTEVASTQATAEEGWAYSFTGLDKYHSQGVEIVYEVSEDAVDGYTSLVDGAGVRNMLQVGQLVVSKHVTGTDAKRAFAFTVTLDDDRVNGQHGDLSFQDGVATFELTDGATATATDLPAGVGYVVEEQGEPGYRATATGDAGTIEAGEVARAAFVNAYSAAGSAELKAVKTLSGRTLHAGEFFFVLEGSDGTVLQRASNAGDGTVAFDPIEYTLADVGRHSYTVREVVPEGDDLHGVDYDRAAQTVVVTVADAGDGTLSVDYGDYDPAGLQFVNSYHAEGSFELHATKSFAGADLAAGAFQFQLEGDGLTAPVTAFNDAEGNVAFPPVSITKPGTYRYTITEVHPEGAVRQGDDWALNGITYDGHASGVTVEAFDNLDGTMKFDIAYDDGDEARFSNVYQAEGALALTAIKHMSGRDFAKGDEFTFVVETPAGAPAPERESVTIRPEGGTEAAIDFGSVQFGLGDVGKTYTYTVREVAGDQGTGVSYDPFAHLVTVSVSDDRTGQLKLDVEYSDGDAMAFTNSYAAEGEAHLFATKTLTGRDLRADEFYFELTGDTIEGLQRVGADGDGLAEFAPIRFTQEDAGKDFHYAIREVDGGLGGVTYDDHEETVTVHVEDNGDGTLAVTYDGKATYAGAAFANTYRTSGTTAVLQAQKVLSGAELAEGQFSFELRGTSDNAADVRQVKANDAQGSVVFDELAYDEPGTYEYEIAEVVPEGAADNGDGTWRAGTVVYDGTAHAVTVTVTDDGQGALAASVSYDGYDSLTVTNGTQLSKVGFGFDKYYFGGTGSFDFRLVAADAEGQPRAGDPVEYTAADQVVDDGTAAFALTVQNGAFANGKARVEFPEISFAADGDYYYVVSEDESDEPGLITDDAQYLVHVTVAGGDVAGTTYELVYDGVNYGPTTDLAFYNNSAVTLGFGSVSAQAYTGLAQKTSVYPQVKKYLNGSTERLVGDDFAFELVDAQSGTTVAVGSNDEAGNVAFYDEESDEGLVFTEPGTYSYLIREVAGDDANVTYDSSVITLTVEVVQGEDGLEATATYGGAVEPGDEPAFYNTAEGMDLTVQKVSRFGGEGLVDCTYALWMVGDNGDALVAEAVSDANGYITFKDVNLIKGERYYFKEVEAPSGHTVDPYRTAYFALNEAGTALELVEETAADGWHSATENMETGTATSTVPSADTATTGGSSSGDEAEATRVSEDN